MENWHLRCLRGACITIMAFGIVPLVGATSSMAVTSSCVQCHTDEDMLEENLSKVKKKGSKMTSGAG